MAERELLDQGAVNYRSAEEGSGSCASCGNFMGPSACSMVKGPVASAGVCDIYAPKAKPMSPEEMFVGK